MLNWSDTSSGRDVKIAVVHDWFASYAGSERVVEQLLAIYPGAIVHAVVDFLSDADRHFLGGREVRTSFIRKLPLARSKFRHYLPLMPAAIEQFDLSGFDVVLSSNHAVAKGVIIGPDQLHVSYVHTPIRYAWDLQHQYLAEAGLNRGVKGLLTRAILHYMRLWDQAAAARVGVFVANSRYIGRRILNTYRREAEVIYPPVDVDAFELQEKKEDFYLAASRMVPYKRMPLIVEAFNAMPDKKLVVVGDGTELAKVKAIAGPNVTVMGYQSFTVLRDLMRRAKAFVFAAEEDFGITPVEAMACGTPVIAFGRGGATESVVDGATGLFFPEQSADSLREAVERFERETDRFDPVAIRQHAEFFRPERFRAEMAALVDREWQAFQRRGRSRSPGESISSPAITVPLAEVAGTS
ncbi:MAG TPA: glycosyltransferase family 4 protein [Tepidisphaeraceae bacterium]|jgi:glycosyltransferase involved in cell wall biosynthesis